VDDECTECRGEDHQANGAAHQALVADLDVCEPMDETVEDVGYSAGQEEEDQANGDADYVKNGVDPGVGGGEGEARSSPARSWAGGEWGEDRGEE